MYPQECCYATFLQMMFQKKRKSGVWCMAYQASPERAWGGGGQSGWLLNNIPRRFRRGMLSGERAAIDRRALLALLAVISMAGAVTLARQWVLQQNRVLALKREELMKLYQAPINVVMASKDIPEGTVIEASSVQMGTVPERFVQPYAARSVQDVVGKATAAPIAKDEQVLSNKLRNADQIPAGSTLSSVTPKGKRAVTIMVDSLTGVGGFVRPGDVVDILWTLKLPGPGNEKEGQVVTLTVFQDVPVLAIDTEMLGRRAAPQAAKAAGGEQKEAQGYMVTLALTPQETSFLLFAREQGRLQLSLRARSEDQGSRAKIVPANMNTLLEMQLGIKQPESPPAAAVPKPPRQVEVYKGLKRDVVTLSEGQ